MRVKGSTNSLKMRVKMTCSLKPLVVVGLAGPLDDGHHGRQFPSHGEPRHDGRQCLDGG